MSKFKVGDKVRVTSMECGHQFNIGEVVSIKDATEYDYAATNGKETWYLIDNEIAPVNQLEVGKTYETQYHGQYNCIAVNETHAWLTVGKTGVAYVWTIDGKSLLGYEWDIVFPPKIEVKHEAVTVAGKQMTIRYEVVDGIADLDNATIEPF